jgi:hypothetical protein
MVELMSKIISSRPGGTSLECKSEVPYVIYSGKRTAVDTPQNAL